MLPNATLIRRPSTVDGTFGKFSLVDGDIRFDCHSLELPWHDNKPRVSCIPAGGYHCEFTHSPKFGAKKYHVVNVPGRSGILIHAGNVAGDEAQGLRSEVEGCILLGLGLGVVGRQPGVVSSGDAIARLERLLAGRSFTLNILSGEIE